MSCLTHTMFFEFPSNALPREVQVKTITGQHHVSKHMTVYCIRRLAELQKNSVTHDMNQIQGHKIKGY